MWKFFQGREFLPSSHSHFTCSSFFIILVARDLLLVILTCYNYNVVNYESLHQIAIFFLISHETSEVEIVRWMIGKFKWRWNFLENYYHAWMDVHMWGKLSASRFGWRINDESKCLSMNQSITEQGTQVIKVQQIKRRKPCTFNAILWFFIIRL